MSDQITLAEAFGSLSDVQQGPAKGRRFRALLIRAGWGSSGYYSEEVLKRDGPKTWPAGTQSYLDHPSVTESMDRPERSVKDLASTITTDPVWDPALGGLVAEVEVFPQWSGLLNEEFASKIGLSIRAYGTSEQGEAEGRTGAIVTSLDEGISVDWVTKAGAGGRVLELIESARALAEAVSDKPWSDFSDADYDIAQWRKACLIHPDTESEAKGDYKLPVREPDGTLNRNAVHAAASVLAGGRSGVKATAAQKKAAAKKLIGLYGQLKEDPPESITKLADATQESARRLQEGRNVGAFMESRIHSHFTTMADDMYGNGKLSRPERIGLSSAIGDGLQAFTDKVTADHPQLYERDLWDGPPDEAGPISEARRRVLREGHGMTANELSAALSDAVRDVYGGDGIFTWVRDNTDEWVVFSVEDGTDCDLYQQIYTADETTGAVTLTGDPVEVVARTSYIPAPPEPDDQAEPTQPAGGPLAEAAKKKEGTMPELTEAQVRELTEAKEKAEAALAEARTALEAERTKVTEAAGVARRVTELEAKLTEADARNQRLENDRAARAQVAAALKGSGLPEVSHPRVTESVCRVLPTAESGVLDSAALGEAITAAITGETTYLAAVAESTGAGVPRGLGGVDRAELAEADIEAELAKAFVGIGLSDDLAKSAAVGR